MSRNDQDRPSESRCFERAVQIVGDRWTLLILWEAAVNGSTQFGEFTEALGLAPSILSGRLAALVAAGVMARRPYREAGARTRYGYHLTPKGEELRSVLAALRHWGDDNRDRQTGADGLARGTDA